MIGTLLTLVSVIGACGLGFAVLETLLARRARVVIRSEDRHELPPADSE